MAGIIDVGRSCVCPDLKYMRQDLDLWSWGDLSFEEMDTLTALQVSYIDIGRHVCNPKLVSTQSYEWWSELRWSKTS